MVMLRLTDVAADLTAIKNLLFPILLLGEQRHWIGTDGLSRALGDADRPVSLSGGPALIGKAEMPVFAEDDMI